MKAVIFDIDGTLVDSVDFHARAWQEALQHFGHNFAFEKIRYQIGKGGDQLMPFFLSEQELELKGKKIEKLRGEIFAREYMPRVKAFPEVRELFECLLSEGWKIALASSAKKEELRAYKDICRIGDLLNTETSSDDVERSKPHPDIFLVAMNRLGNVRSWDCVVVGDSPYDAEAAGKAGVQAVGFLSGGFSREELSHAGCEIIYKDPADLLMHLPKSLFRLAYSAAE